MACQESNTPAEFPSQVMEKEYHDHHWHKDPMHPVHYEGTDEARPFIEYTLSKIFLPERIVKRQQLSEKYQLTARESSA